MPEARAEQIVIAIVGLIRGIVGDGGATYWHSYGGGSANRTERFHALTEAVFDESLDTWCAVIPDDSAKRRETNKTHIAEMRLDLVVAKRFKAEDRPYKNRPDPDRQLLQSRLAQDVERVLMQDPALNAFRGLEVIDLRITSEDRSAETTFDPMFAIVILRAAVTYRYRPNAP